MSCLICAETLNGSTHKLIKCEFCDFEACLTCCKTYVLGETYAKCMGECNKEWSRQFLAKTFGQTFMTKNLKKHREEVLFEKERALLPATQPVVENLMRLDQLKARIKEIDAERSRLAREKQDVWQQIYYLQDREPERAVFTKACPGTNCRGFLSTQWTCGLCEVYTCPECHEQKGEDHTCNPDQVATARMLENDTKPCPKCQTPIFKIDGCDQMWCTQCHTAFSWRTGKTETVIHNPHYYEWMRKQSVTGEIPRAQDCRALTQHTAVRIARLSGDPRSARMEFLQEIVRNTLHIQHVELRGKYEEIDHVAVNRDLRVSYMRGSISEEKFKVLLQRSEKSTAKCEEIRSVLLMLVATVTDIVMRLGEDLQYHPKDDVFSSFTVEMKSIQEYTNEQLQEVSKAYKCVPLQFDDALGIMKRDA